MENAFHNDIAVLVVIEHLANMQMLHRWDYRKLAQRLHTKWARATAKLLARKKALDADSDALLTRFSMRPRTRVSHASSQPA